MFLQMYDIFSTRKAYDDRIYIIIIITAEME